MAANEARFRELNEGAQERRRETGDGRFVCECANSGCMTWLVVEATDYERIRRNPLWFIIAPGHDKPEIERVVERHDGYDVVEKPPEVAHIVAPDGEGQM